MNNALITMRRDTGIKRYRCFIVAAYEEKAKLY
jgi:hypothetical protein